MFKTTVYYGSQIYIKHDLLHANILQWWIFIKSIDIYELTVLLKKEVLFSFQ